MMCSLITTYMSLGLYFGRRKCSMRESEQSIIPIYSSEPPNVALHRVLAVCRRFFAEMRIARKGRKRIRVQ